MEGILADIAEDMTQGTGNPMRNTTESQVIFPENIEFTPLSELSVYSSLLPAMEKPEILTPTQNEEWKSINEFLSEPEPMQLCPLNPMETSYTPTCKNFEFSFQPDFAPFMLTNPNARDAQPSDESHFILTDEHKHSFEDMEVKERKSSERPQRRQFSSLNYADVENKYEDSDIGHHSSRIPSDIELVRKKPTGESRRKRSRIPSVHNNAERVRRADLKSCLDRLQDSIPALEGKRNVFQGQVLDSCIEYIRELEHEDREFEFRIEEAKSKNKYLKELLAKSGF